MGFLSYCACKGFGYNVFLLFSIGNLGRLYQTMKRYEEAEQMHLKAIQIKEALLGPEDYEVALSIGHLASLYNYDLKEFNKAEELYLRSIEISLRLFGPSYSGLEYDYRGLIKVYDETGDVQNFAKYILNLRGWLELKEAKEGEENHSDNLNFTLKGRTSRPHHQIMQMIDQLSDDSTASVAAKYHATLTIQSNSDNKEL